MVSYASASPSLWLRTPLPAITTYTPGDSVGLGRKEKGCHSLRRISGTPSMSATAVTTEPGYGAKSRNRQPRMVTFRDPSTSRIVRYPVFTAAAFAALQATPITYSVPVVGSATAVTYNQDKLDPERVARRI